MTTPTRRSTARTSRPQRSFAKAESPQHPQEDPSSRSSPGTHRSTQENNHLRRRERCRQTILPPPLLLIDIQSVFFPQKLEAPCFGGLKTATIRPLVSHICTPGVANGMVYYPSDCSPQLTPTSVETQRGGGEIGRRTSLRC